MSETVHLALPHIAAAQAQKHVTHNEALRILDALVMLAVKDRDLSAPPGSPAEGDRYLVKATATGGFAGKDGQIAYYRDGAWAFHAPQAGWICYIDDEDAPVVFDGSAWLPLLGASPELQNLARLGLVINADATNPFAAKLNNALWTARNAGEGGDGDLRYKLNKETAGNTLSLLFQTGYSGRAELGLTGDDDLHLKVSDDGTTWRDAMIVAAADGSVSFPFGIAGARERLTAARTYYVRTDGSDANDGLADSASGAFLTIQKAIDVVFETLDLGGFDVTIQVADGTYNESVGAESRQVGAGTVTIKGNASDPENVIVIGQPGGLGTFFASGGAHVVVKDLEVRNPSGHCLYARWGSVLHHDNLRFGDTFGIHIVVSFDGIIVADGNSAIVGDATEHYHAHGGAIREQSTTVTLSGTPAFTVFANANSGGQIICSATFDGAATGRRFQIRSGAQINTSGQGLTYFPGDTDGVTETGGVYFGFAGPRERLLSARTYYVRSDGSDDNDGRANTSGGAFATIGKAVRVAFSDLDLNGFGVTIQLADGTYAGNIIQRAPHGGTGTITIQGNVSNPENVIVSTTAANCFSMSHGAQIVVRDLTLRTTTSGAGVSATFNGTIDLNNVVFGTCAGNHIFASDGGTVRATGNYKIAGGATSHFACNSGGAIRVQGRTITITGTPTFTVFASAQIAGIQIVNGNTFAGSATGKRYQLETNAVVSTGGAGASYLPGDVDGSAGSGAEYA